MTTPIQWLEAQDLKVNLYTRSSGRVYNRGGSTLLGSIKCDMCVCTQPEHEAAGEWGVWDVADYKPKDLDPYDVCMKRGAPA
jgi:hypothetical protein